MESPHGIGSSRGRIARQRGRHPLSSPVEERPKADFLVMCARVYVDNDKVNVIDRVAKTGGE